MKLLLRSVRTPAYHKGSRFRVPRKPLGTAQILVIAAISGTMAAAIGSTLLASGFDWLIGGPLALLGAAFFLAYRNATEHRLSGGWFHPLSLPSLYVAGVLTVPLLWVQWTTQRLGFLSHEGVTVRLVWLSVVATSAFVAGAAIAVAIAGRRRRGSGRGPDGVNWNLLGQLGLILLVSILGLSVISRALTWGAPYGAGAVQYSFESFAGAFAATAFVPAAILFLVSRQVTNQRLTAPHFGLPLLVAMVMVVSGDRATILSLLILAAWFINTYRRPIRGVALALYSGIVIISFGLMAQIRGGTGLPVGSLENAANVGLTSISSPLGISGVLLELVPTIDGFTFGRTYIASLRYLVPGPIARSLFGDDLATGSFVFRELLTFENKDAGFSFSLISEGYLNFGWWGVVASSALAGAFVAWAWGRGSEVMTRSLNYLYPLTIASFPLLFRSDFLTQAKTILYGQALVFGALTLARSANHGASQPKARTSSLLIHGRDSRFPPRM